MGVFHVGTLKSSDDRSAETHFLHNVDQTLSNGVTTNDTTEDVDENRRHLRVARDQLKSRLDGGRSSATTDIEEVGRASTVELDDVHGGHGKTSTVDYRLNKYSSETVKDVCQFLPKHPISPSSLMKFNPCLAQSSAVANREISIHKRGKVEHTRQP